MKKIEGIDISHWNSITAIDEFEPEFVIMKATEGKTYNDPKMVQFYSKCVELGLATGFYHFARAEKNNFKEEADWFVENIPVDAVGKCILVLDFEAKSLSIKNVDDWALGFCLRVEELTGVKPLLYCSQSVVKRFPKVAANNNGLWVARYRNKRFGYGDVSPWKWAAIWQYSSKGVDKNIFYGSLRQFYMYGERRK